MSEKEAIAKSVQLYIDGARLGQSGVMKPAFHEAATIFGFDGTTLFGGPIQKLFDDVNGPATGLEASIVSIDVIGTIAAVRLELKNWSGVNYTDLFTLLKVDGQWKIMNKVFHVHA
ncbi:MAG TPA: nuclear transport factor 2 family protein [Steroidobacteraceae bacterium]|nr:nuclear transport factor 2 family protein [Steroidobacteraceae bacterium]